MKIALRELDLSPSLLVDDGHHAVKYHLKVVLTKVSSRLNHFKTVPLVLHRRE